MSTRIIRKYCLFLEYPRILAHVGTGCTAACISSNGEAYALQLGPDYGRFENNNDEARSTFGASQLNI